MRIDVMCDIETLGNKTDSTIFQIAAIAFDIKTGEYFQTFNQKADISQSDNLNVTGSTLLFWLNKNKELLTELLNNGEIPPLKLLSNFRDFLKGLNSTKKQSSEVFLWGNGILFDNKMIQYQLESFKMSYPIFYRNDRDMRTLVELASHKMGIATEKELREQINKTDNPDLIRHDAFDDVRGQINVLCKCYNLLVNDVGIQ